MFVERSLSLTKSGGETKSPTSRVYVINYSMALPMFDIHRMFKLGSSHHVHSVYEQEANTIARTCRYEGLPCTLRRMRNFVKLTVVTACAPNTASSIWPSVTISCGATIIDGLNITYGIGFSFCYVN